MKCASYLELPVSYTFATDDWFVTCVLLMQQTLYYIVKQFCANNELVIKTVWIGLKLCSIINYSEQNPAWGYCRAG
jgi:hypothetical protein